MKRRIRSPYRPPFITVEDRVYVDLLYTGGNELLVDFEKLVAWLARARPGTILVARRLTRREVRLLREEEADAHDGTYGKIESDLLRRMLGIEVP
jgi:hypothetical protein